MSVGRRCGADTSLRTLAVWAEVRGVETPLLDDPATEERVSRIDSVVDHDDRLTGSGDTDVMSDAALHDRPALGEMLFQLEVRNDVFDER